MNRLVIAILLWFLAAPWLLFPHTVPFLTIFSLLLLSGAWIWVAHRRRRVMAATPLNGFVLVYLLLAAAAYLMAPLPAEAFPKLTTLLFGIYGYWLALEWLLPPGGNVPAQDDDTGAFPAGLTLLAGFLALAGGLIALGTLFAAEWPQRQLVDVSFLTGRIPHLTGSFTIHPNEAAGTLLFLLPFALFLVRLRWRPELVETSNIPTFLSARRLSMLGWLLLISMLAVLALMQSRAALLALAGMVLLMVVWGRWRLRWFILAGAVGGLVLISAWAFMDITLTQVSAWVSAVDALSKQGALAPQSWPMRREVWSAAGQMLLDYPVFGAGLDSFVPVSRANYPYFAMPVSVDFAHAHNLWLQAGADMGWPGILATTLLLVVPLCGLWLAARPEQTRLQPWTLPFGTGLAGYLLFNLLDTISPLQRPGVLIWFVLAGSAAILAHSGLLTGRIRYVALTPIILLLVLSVSPPAGQNRANQQLDRARLAGDPLPALDDLTDRRRCIWMAHQQQWAEAEACFAGWPEAVIFLQSQGLLAAYAQDPAGALSWYNMALALDETAASVYFWRSQLYEQEGDIGRTQAGYEQAIRYADKQGLSKDWQAHIYYQLGRIYAGQQSWTKALHNFRKAIELDETQPIYYEALGDILLAMGDDSGAAAAYEKAGKK